MRRQDGRSGNSAKHPIHPHYRSKPWSSIRQQRHRLPPHHTEVTGAK
jgi:hypothetical protein